MIRLLDKTRKNRRRFANYHDLIDHIHRIERSKSKLFQAINRALKLPDEEEQWCFTYYKHTDLSVTYSWFRDPPLTEIERQAFQQGLDVIEINYGGDLLTPVQFAVTADLDIESLKKDWCEAYCKAHGYTLMEGANDESHKK